MEASQETAYTLRVILDWPRSWLVEHPTVKRLDGTKEIFWLPKRRVQRVRDAGAEHVVFNLPSDIIEREGL